MKFPTEEVEHITGTKRPDGKPESLSRPHK
jgi:hypothetical protein